MTLGTTIVPTPLLDVPFVGEKLVFDNVDMTFIVDEHLENYREIHNWMVNIGFPRAHGQFMAQERPANTVDRNIINPTLRNKNASTGSPGMQPDRSLYSRIAIDVLSSKNNPILRIDFLEAFPVSLGSLQYGVDNTDTDYLIADVSFQYMLYEFKTI